MDVAFEKTLLDKRGEKLPLPSTPEAWVELSLKHLKEWSDPILDPYLFSLCDPAQVFVVDTVAYERQLQRMRVGLLYQHLIRELMYAAHGDQCNVKAVFDGFREADLIADVKTPGNRRGLRLYVSIKKHSQTVGGQDFGGVVTRIEDEASSVKNINSPYLCVFAYGTLTQGKLRGYHESRKIRYTRSGEPYSENCECWEPGFIFPYVCGWSPIEVYKLASQRIAAHMPFYSLRHQALCARLLGERLKQLGLVTVEGKLDRDKYLEFILTEGVAP